MGSCTWPATLLARTSCTLLPARASRYCFQILAVQWANSEFAARGPRGASPATPLWAKAEHLEMRPGKSPMVKYVTQAGSASQWLGALGWWGAARLQAEASGLMVLLVLVSPALLPHMGCVVSVLVEVLSSNTCPGRGRAPGGAPGELSHQR